MSDQWTEDDVRNMLCNPIYAGVFPYPALVSREQWITAAMKAIDEDGADAFLTRMLDALDASMRAAATTFDEMEVS